MKKAIISLFFLIIIYIMLDHNALDVIGSDAFHYAAYILFAVVMGCAVYFVGVKNPQREEQNNAVTPNGKDAEDEK